MPPPLISKEAALTRFAYAIFRMEVSMRSTTGRVQVKTNVWDRKANEWNIKHLSATHIDLHVKAHRGKTVRRVRGLELHWSN